MYESITKASSNHGSYHVGGKTLAEARANAMQAHTFTVGNCEGEAGTVVTTIIEALCETCEGASRVPGKQKRRVRFAPWLPCKACKGMGTIGVVETFETTIGEA